MGEQDSGENLGIAEMQDVTEEGGHKLAFGRMSARRAPSVGDGNCGFQRFLTCCLPTWN